MQFLWISPTRVSLIPWLLFQKNAKELAQFKKGSFKRLWWTQEAKGNVSYCVHSDLHIQDVLNSSQFGQIDLRMNEGDYFHTQDK